MPALLLLWTLLLTILPALAQEPPAEEPAAEDGEEEGGEKEADKEGDGEEGEEKDGEEKEGEEPAKEYPKPEQVHVGVHINDILSIELKDHTYAMDAYIWFRWKDPEIDPATSMEFINPSEQWGHMITPNYEEPEELPSGELYQVIRVTGRFGRKLPLYNYPFDRQVLTMVFEDSVHDSSELVYVVDEVTLNPDLVLPGYTLGQPRLSVLERPYNTNFGDLRLTQPSPFSRGIIEVPVERPRMAYAAKLLLPVLCTVVCATLMLLLAPAYVDSRVDVGITSLLTVVALQLTYNQDLPDVGYLMLMDKIYLLSYGFVIAGLAVVVRSTSLMDRKDLDSAVRLHRQMLIASVLVYAVGVAYFVGKAINEG